MLNTPVNTGYRSLSMSSSDSLFVSNIPTTTGPACVPNIPVNIEYRSLSISSSESLLVGDLLHTAVALTDVADPSHHALALTDNGKPDVSNPVFVVTSDTKHSVLSPDALNELSAPATQKRVSVAIGDASTGNNGYSPVVILNETAWQQQFHNGGYP